MKNTIGLAAFVLLIASCWDWKRLPPVSLPPLTKVMGYVPVYSHDSGNYRIYSDTPRAMRNAGKIYVKDNLIFQNDNGYGIHVIDKTDPSSPKKIGFINLMGNLEMSIKGNYLYANSYDDLVVIDISNWHSVKVIQRIKHAFMQGSTANYTNYTNALLFIPPPEKNIHYECVDPSKGILAGWTKDSVYINACYYY